MSIDPSLHIFVLLCARVKRVSEDVESVCEREKENL